ncbi:MAG: class IV adenylate cyclase [Pseudomonadota bacterium]
MPSNIEIKARVDNLSALEARVRTQTDQPAEYLEQDDTFFHCPVGRLKLRDFGDGTGELIAYRRDDESGPKTSQYRISRTQDPAGLRDTLSDALGVLGRVRKSRRVIMIGRTRVHLDQVKGLGDFMELEVVLAEGESPEDGFSEARSLMQSLAIAEGDLIQGAYLDHLLARD